MYHFSAYRGFSRVAWNLSGAKAPLGVIFFYFLPKRVLILAHFERAVLATLKPLSTPRGAVTPGEKNHGETEIHKFYSKKKS